MNNFNPYPVMQVSSNWRYLYQLKDIQPVIASSVPVFMPLWGFASTMDTDTEIRTTMPLKAVGVQAPIGPKMPKRWTAFPHHLKLLPEAINAVSLHFRRMTRCLNGKKFLQQMSLAIHEYGSALMLIIFR